MIFISPQPWTFVVPELLHKEIETVGKSKCTTHEDTIQPQKKQRRGIYSPK